MKAAMCARRTLQESPLTQNRLWEVEKREIQKWYNLLAPATVGGYIKNRVGEQMWHDELIENRLPASRRGMLFRRRVWIYLECHLDFVLRKKVQLSEDSKHSYNTERPDARHDQEAGPTVNLEHASSAYILAQRRSNMRHISQQARVE